MLPTSLGQSLLLLCNFGLHNPFAPWVNSKTRRNHEDWTQLMQKAFKNWLSNLMLEYLWHFESSWPSLTIMICSHSTLKFSPANQQPRHSWWGWGRWATVPWSLEGVQRILEELWADLLLTHPTLAAHYPYDPHCSNVMNIICLPWDSKDQKF